MRMQVMSFSSSSLPSPPHSPLNNRLSSSAGPGQRPTPSYNRYRDPASTYPRCYSSTCCCCVYYYTLRHYRSLRVALSHHVLLARCRRPPRAPRLCSRVPGSRRPYHRVALSPAWGSKWCSGSVVSLLPLLVPVALMVVVVVVATMSGSRRRHRRHPAP